MIERDNNLFQNKQEAGSLPSREAAILDTIQQIEVPFMEAMRETYGPERGWRICGPSSIALSRILSAKTGVPIGLGLQGEHIELEVGVYDPQEEPDRLSRMEEQTYIKYYVGDGNVYYIDPIYGLLMGNVQDLQGAIQVEKYQVSEIDKALLERHNLHSFSPDHPDITKVKPWSTLIKIMLPLSDWYLDNITILNDERATMAACIADSGHEIVSDCDKVEAVITRFAPNWQTDAYLERKIKRYQQVLKVRLGNIGNKTTSGIIMGMENEYSDFFPSDFGLNTKFQGIEPIYIHFPIRPEKELRYDDQEPRMEKWRVDSESEKRQPVLTYHVNNERYILKPGEELTIYKNGIEIEVTEERIQKLKNAVDKIGDKKLIGYLNRNL